MSLCILTDNSALFPPTQAGHGKYLRTLPLRQANKRAIPPIVEDFTHAFTELEREFHSILVLTSAESLLPAHHAAQTAILSHGGTAKIAVLDSQQSGPGLGLLAQLGARAAADGQPLPAVIERIRAAIPHLYTLLCIESQLPAPEENNSTPVFSLEDGQLIPYKKVRTRRHLLESFQEFVEEFETPQHIVYFRGPEPGLRARPLRDKATELFPGIPFTEMEVNPALAAVFGHPLVGMTIMELPQ